MADDDWKAGCFWGEWLLCFGSWVRMPELAACLRALASPVADCQGPGQGDEWRDSNGEEKEGWHLGMCVVILVNSKFFSDVRK